MKTLFLIAAVLMISLPSFAQEMGLVARSALESAEGKAIVERALASPTVAEGVARFLGIATTDRLMSNSESVRGMLLNKLQNTNSADADHQVATILKLDTTVGARNTNTGAKSLDVGAELRAATASADKISLGKKPATNSLVSQIDEVLVTRFQKGEITAAQKTGFEAAMSRHPEMLGKGLLGDCGKLTTTQFGNLVSVFRAGAAKSVTSAKAAAVRMRDRLAQVTRVSTQKASENLCEMTRACNYFQLPEACAL